MQPREWIIEQPDQLQRLAGFLARLKTDRPVRITLDEYVDKRTSDQNARLWKLHTLAANEVGVSAEDMHEEMLCQHYGYTEIRLPSGRIKNVPLKRSSQRNKKEFSLFMEFCEAFYATELGVIL